MIKANFNTYASYVTDSLYQWDLNQVLSVSGLNLSVVPEVHFSNANMDKAIVRQATKVNNVVRVTIPNSLLQDPLTIYAHIGIYEGDTFKVVERVDIPVIPKNRPSDYRIEDADEEIYSFNALENLVTNAVASVDQKCNQTVEAVNEIVEDLESQVVLKKCSACVVFSPAYKNAYGEDFIASSIVPLLNAEMYSSINISGNVNIVGLSNNMGASRFTISRYGTGFALFSTDSTAVQTVAGKVVSFEFTLTK